MTDMNMQNKNVAIAISSLVFSWNDGSDPVLNIEHLHIKRSERVFIEGPSGSGKSTLLSLIAGVTIPQNGSVTVNGIQLNAISGAARDRFRADHIGFIYQMFNLIPFLTVVENVTLPCRFSRHRRSRAANRAGSVEAEAMQLLSKLGMAHPALVQKTVNDLSVGQQQRVAVARALIGSPDILIADEPTSSLDADHRQAFIEMLFHECDRENTTLVYVSHDRTLEAVFDRTIRLVDINAVQHTGAIGG